MWIDVYCLKVGGKTVFSQHIQRGSEYGDVSLLLTAFSDREFQRYTSNVEIYLCVFIGMCGCKLPPFLCSVAAAHSMFLCFV